MSEHPVTQGIRTQAKEVPLAGIRIRDPWFDHYVERVRDTVIPYQYRALHDEVEDAEPSHAIRNLEAAARKLHEGEKDGRFKGFVFQDSDLAKWLEAVAYSLAQHPDPELKRQADAVIDKVEAAQCEDGYLNTFFTLNAEDQRWKNLCDCHELYVAGHFIEAGVAYFEATDERKLLDVVIRFADLLCEVFGPGEGQIHGYPGHEEVELALVRLWRVTGTDRYLALAEYFIRERGQAPNYFVEERNREDFFEYYPGTKGNGPILDYTQAERPVMEQTHAEGHAVRAGYLYTGMAEVAAARGDEALLAKTVELWEDITRHQMYVTGGVGQSGTYERFTCPDDLPNDANYSETCASIALAMLSVRLGQITADARYHDIVELELYNGIPAGISEDGTRFFYVNPMEVWPENCMPNTSRGHVKPVRQRWFACACCPPNLARTFAGLGRYMLSLDTETDETPTLYVQQYIGQETTVALPNGEATLTLSGDYALDGTMTVELRTPTALRLALRMPGWSEHPTLAVDDGGQEVPETERGYVYLTFEAGTHKVELDFDPRVDYLVARPEVRQDRGLVALRRGPLIWAAESVDNGENLAALTVVPGERDTLTRDGHYSMLEVTGAREIFPSWPEEALYRPLRTAALRREPTNIRCIPYAFWGNRSETPNEMRVWLRRAAEASEASTDDTAEA